MAIIPENPCNQKSLLASTKPDVPEDRPRDNVPVGSDNARFHDEPAPALNWLASSVFRNDTLESQMKIRNGLLVFAAVLASIAVLWGVFSVGSVLFPAPAGSGQASACWLPL